MSGSPTAAAHVEPLLEAYHAGALPPEDAARVERHLRACAACREKSEALAIYQIIRSAPAPTVGPELRQRLYTRIASASEASEARGESSRAARLASREGRDVGRPSRARPRRLHLGGAWVSGAVAVLIVALLVSGFWALPHLRQQNHASKKVVAKITTACPASATSATLPANAVLNDMALTSSTEGWAVGALEDDQGNTTQGLIMRYSACHWASIALDLPGVMLTSLSMDSPTDGWAAGYVNNANGFVLLHDINGVWSIVGASQRPANHGSVTALSMVSPDEGWIATMGPDDTPNSSGSVSVAKSRLWQDVQGSWINVAYPMPIIDAIAPVGPADIWVAGSDYTGPTKQLSHSFAHYHNGAWTVTPQPAKLWTQILYVVSPTDIWASGMTTDQTSIVAHYDGVAWSESPDSFPSAVANGNGVGIAFGAGEGWAYTFRAPNAATPSPESMRALVGSVLRETGGRWQALSWPYNDLNWLSSFSPISNSEFWVIGNYLLEVTTPNGNHNSSSVIFSRSVLLHYANGIWSRYG